MNKELGYKDLSSKDKEVVMKAIENRGISLSFASTELRKDPNFVLAAIKKKGVALRYADPSIKSNREFLLTAIKMKSLAFKYVNPRFKKDKMFVLDAVKANGLALRYAVDYQNDLDVVTAALNQNKKAIKYVGSTSLQYILSGQANSFDSAYAYDYNEQHIIHIYNLIYIPFRNIRPFPFF